MAYLVECLFITLCFVTLHCIGDNVTWVIIIKIGVLVLICSILSLMTFCTSRNFLLSAFVNKLQTSKVKCVAKEIINDGKKKRSKLFEVAIGKI